MTVRIAMWSGPRNASTALARAFDARGDCTIIDEPLYAAYLRTTGLEHPAREAILESQPDRVTAALAALRQPADTPLQFEKHMAQHWQPDWPLEELQGARHAFLIRDPRSVAASYARVRGAPTTDDLGTLQQARLAERLGGPVIDGDDLCADPRGMLRSLCAALDIDYTDRMLTWAPGPRPSDGIWAPHWYDRVASSTGFVSSRPPPQALDPDLAALAASLTPTYRALAARRLRPLT